MTTNGKIDVFLRCAPQNEIRLGMTLTCIAYWKSVPGARLKMVVAGPSFGGVTISNAYWIERVLPIDGFHWSSRQWADEMAETEPYVLADDDRLPIGMDWLERAKGLWEKYNAGREYVMLNDRSSSWVDDCLKVIKWNGVDEVVPTEPHWLGANYLSYKGAVPYAKFKGKADTQDPDIGDWAARNGKRQLMMTGVVVNHLGLGFSQVQPKLWGRY